MTDETTDPQEEGEQSEPIAQPEEAELSAVLSPVSDETRSGSDAEPRRGTSNTLSLLALLVAVIAAAGAGYLWWQQMRSTSEVTTQLDRAVDESVDRVARLNEALDAVKKELDGLESEQESLARKVQTLEGLNQQLDAQRRRLQSTEAALESLQGVSVAARQTWLLAEADYLLEVANTRIRLEKDLQTALAALEAADSRLAAAGDPVLIPVREAIADSIAAIEAVPRVDIEKAALRLGSLTRRVAELDFKGETPESAEIPEAPDTQDATMFDRFKASLGQAFNSMVSVRRIEDTTRPPISPEERYFVYANTELLLGLTRSALLRGDQDEFRAALTAAGDWITANFDSSDADVAAAQRTIEDLAALDIAPSLPDISTPLSLLRAIEGNEGTP